MFKIENDNVECESLKVNQGADVAQQLSVGNAGLMIAFKGTTTDGEWTTLPNGSNEVPAGLSENLLIQCVARENATGDSAAMTYNGLVISNADGLSLTPADMMNSLSCA